MATARSFVRNVLCLAALTINPPAHAGTANVELGTTGTPAGFDELARARENLVDIYFGGRKVGEALVITKPGSLQFKSARDVLEKIPELIPSPELTSILTAELPTNDDAVCRAGNAGNCGVITPDVVGIIYDADRFRVDVFANPKFLKVFSEEGQGFLPVPNAPLSLTSSVGLALSGSLGQSSVQSSRPDRRRPPQCAPSRELIHGHWSWPRDR